MTWHREAQSTCIKPVENTCCDRGRHSGQIAPQSRRDLHAILDFGDDGQTSYQCRCRLPLIGPGQPPLPTKEFGSRHSGRASNVCQGYVRSGRRR